MEGTFRLMTIKKKKGILAAGLMKLLHDNKDTEYGKKYDFANIHSIREYQDKVPLCDYDTLEPYIRRMVLDDEENLLCAERPVHYALSSGSVGVPKHIPVSAAELERYRNYGTCMCIGVVDEYNRNTIGRSFKPGLGADCLELKFQETKYGIPKGAISGNILKQVKGITKYFLTPPWDVLNPIELLPMRRPLPKHWIRVCVINSYSMPPTEINSLIPAASCSWKRGGVRSS